MTAPVRKIVRLHTAHDGFLSQVGRANSFKTVITTQNTTAIDLGADTRRAFRKGLSDEVTEKFDTHTKDFLVGFQVSPSSPITPLSPQDKPFDLLNQLPRPEEAKFWWLKLDPASSSAAAAQKPSKSKSSGRSRPQSMLILPHGNNKPSPASSGMHSPSSSSTSKTSKSPRATLSPRPATGVIPPVKITFSSPLEVQFRGKASLPLLLMRILSALSRSIPDNILETLLVQESTPPGFAELKAKFETVEDAHIDSPQLAWCLFVHWLSELPQPIIPFRFYPVVLAFATIQSPGRLDFVIKLLLSILDFPNRSTLSFILALTSALARKITPASLAQHLAPLICRPAKNMDVETSDPSAIVTAMTKLFQDASGDCDMDQSLSIANYSLAFAIAQEDITFQTSQPDTPAGPVLVPANTVLICRKHITQQVAQEFEAIDDPRLLVFTGDVPPAILSLESDDILPPVPPMVGRSKSGEIRLKVKKEKFKSSGSNSSKSSLVPKQKSSEASVPFGPTAAPQAGVVVGSNPSSFERLAQLEKRNAELIALTGRMSSNTQKLLETLAVLRDLTQSSPPEFISSVARDLLKKLEDFA